MSVKKNMYKTMDNIIEAKRYRISELISEVDVSGISTKEESIAACDYVSGKISGEILSSVREIMNGAGPNIAARFDLLLLEPSIAYDVDITKCEYLDVLTMYMLACYAMTGQGGNIELGTKLLTKLHKYIDTEVYKASGMPPHENAGVLFSQDDFKKLKRTVVMLSVICIIFVSCFGVSMYKINALNEQINKLNEIITSNRDSIATYAKSLKSCQESLSQYYGDFAYITESGKHYHKWGCPYIKDSSLRVNNIEAWERQGYTECSYCYGNDFIIGEIKTAAWQ